MDNNTDRILTTINLLFSKICHHKNLKEVKLKLHMETLKESLALWEICLFSYVLM